MDVGARKHMLLHGEGGGWATAFAHGCHRSRANTIARVQTLTWVAAGAFGRRRLRLHIDFVTCPDCVCAQSSQGIKVLFFCRIPHFASTQSFLAWICPLAAPCKNLMDKILALIYDCVTISVNCIVAPLIAFIFYIISVHITLTTSRTNGQAEKRDKGIGAMVYIASRWIQSEMCVLRK